MFWTTASILLCIPTGARIAFLCCRTTVCFSLWMILVLACTVVVLSPDLAAVSFERIRRSNLIDTGILPLQLLDDHS